VDYEYDDLYRLTAEIITDPGATAPTRTIEYIYDAVGNRLSRTDTGEGTTLYTYDDNDRLLTATTDGVATTYTYDNNGNTTSKTTDGTTITYTWNADNRLIGADTDGDGAIDVVNQYNEDGIRVSQTVNGEETRFLIDANRPYAQVLEEYTPGGIIKVSYVHGNDLISQNRGGEKSFYHVDGLGSTRVLSSNERQITEQNIYGAFGRTLNDGESIDNPYLYVGERRDFNVGLDYLRERYFSPQYGRFISRDPFVGFLEEPISRHKYIYANGNPVNYTDPTGLFSLSETISSVGIRGVLSNVGTLAKAQAVATYINYADYFVGALNLGLNLFYARYLGFDNAISLKFRAGDEIITVGAKLSNSGEDKGKFEVTVNAAPTLKNGDMSYGGATLKLVFDPKNDYSFLPDESRLELPGSFFYGNPLATIGIEGSLGLGVSRESISTVDLKVKFEFLKMLGFSVGLVPFNKLGKFEKEFNSSFEF
jgi:RHS repeat-associated protein